MNKGQRGNKEVKKPKKEHPANPPGIPEGLAPTVGGMPKNKKR